MNQYQITLYNQLMALVDTNEAFSKKDQELDGIIYRVFSYRLAGYQDFCLPGALECRGIMFELDADQPVRLAAMPMEKFFNDGENPFTIGLDYKKLEQSMLKMDGSLMSTYLHKGVLKIKSKTSLSSEHCINAMRYLARPENEELKDELHAIAEAGYTVNMEYTSPEPYMRIVIGYTEPKLTVLNIRDTENGSYVLREALKGRFEKVLEHWVATNEVEDGNEFMASIPALVGIEGYVVQLPSGQFVKKKTDWYRALHFSKDSVNNPRRLFEAVLEETTDDLKEMFKDDPESLKAIAQMEELVSHLYNHLVSTVEDFYEVNKHLDRKDYAVNGQKVLDKKGFSLAMLLYQGKPFSYKEMMKKWYKEYGIKDTVQEKGE